ncbi:response regulator transcription factor [Bacillus sp. FSL K6-3431]|uniref:response regulator transcription factor n=1 Tax=Bacillus sp. FSL K6-3431 TaxID=2921500 RepID=UPI0030F9B709
MYKVLIVDDERNIRHGIQAMITRKFPQTFECIVANNGVSALELMQTDEVDILLTDIKMPEMDGIRLVKEIQKLKCKPEVIIISGYDDFEYAKQAIKYQVKDYLLKPINRNELYDTLERILQDVESANDATNDFDEYRANQLNYIFIHPNIIEKEIEAICLKVLLGRFSGGYYVGAMIDNGTEKLAQIRAITTKRKSGEEVLCFSDKNRNMVLITSTASIFTEISLQYEGKDCAIGVSEKQYYYSKMKKAYEQSIFALKNHFLFTGKTCIQYADLKHKDVDKNVPIDDLKKIANMLGTNRDQEIKTRLLEVLNVGEISTLGIAYMEKLHIAINTIILDSAYSKLGEESIEILKHHDKVGDMYNFENFYDYYYALEQLILLLHEYSKQLKSVYSEQKNMEKAIRYIHENYHKDLNMAVVSNHVSLNYSYFSHMFKEYTGNSFVDYLKKVRVNQSKKLLTSPDLKIFEISYMVGYKNPKQFTRVFRELEGVSPKEYNRGV